MISIENKEDLHKVLDKMLNSFPEDKQPSEIAICESLAFYDPSIKENKSYKEIPTIVYRHWFADRRIVITSKDKFKVSIEV